MENVFALLFCFELALRMMSQSYWSAGDPCARAQIAQGMRDRRLDFSGSVYDSFRCLEEWFLFAEVLCKRFIHPISY